MSKKIRPKKVKLAYRNSSYIIPEENGKEKDVYQEPNGSLFLWPFSEDYPRVAVGYDDDAPSTFTEDQKYFFIHERGIAKAVDIIIDDIPDTELLRAPISRKVKLAYLKAMIESRFVALVLMNSIKFNEKTLLWEAARDNNRKLFDSDWRIDKEGNLYQVEEAPRRSMQE